MSDSSSTLFDGLGAEPPSTGPYTMPPKGGDGLAEQAKLAGMDEAAANKVSLLTFARGIAVGIAIASRRPVTADDVQAALVACGIDERALGNAAGSLFRGPLWRFTGQRVRSVREHSHANEIKCWAFVGASSDDA